MKRTFKAVAMAAAGIAVAWLAPTQALAACANPGVVGIAQCLSAGGGFVVDPAATQWGGTFWVGGQGNDAQGTGGAGDVTGGNDAGQLAVFPSTLDATQGFLTDFGNPGSGILCVAWDWGAFGADGCPDASLPLSVLVRDDAGNAALMQVAAVGGTYDFDAITNGGASPQGGTNNGVPFSKAIHVSGSADLGTTVEVTVNAPNLVSYDDLGGARAVPGARRLRGTLSGNPVNSTGNTLTVDADTSVCADLVDGAYTVTLGCRSIGGNTPSQNVVNGKADLSKGGAKFTWDVTAQFDVAGFNVYQKNVTKGTERKLNGVLIPLSGDNDATAEAYSFSAQRSDLRAVKGGFEIELVRQNGETLRAPVAVTR